MTIDFKKIDEQHIEHFKDGEGVVSMRSFSDGKCKIMRITLVAGASIGQHTHVENCEIVRVLEGNLTAYCDGNRELLHAGDVHYCPQGHSHRLCNETQCNVVFLGIVPELR